jgi:SOS response regulatory protein OraA/RecX
LFEKKFSKDKIDLILNEHFLQEWKSLLDENSVLRKIEILKSKGKSKQYITSKLIERSEDNELVNKCLDNIFSNEWDLDNLKIEYNKLKNKYDTKKIIERLLRKWFKYDDIKKNL